MANFQVDPESIERAEKLSSRLVNDLRKASADRANSQFREFVLLERGYVDEGTEPQIADVIENINQMATDFALARRWDGKVPCLRLKDGGLAPITFNEFFGASASEGRVMVDHPIYFEPSFAYGRWREVLRTIEKEADDNIVLTEVPEAEERVQKSLNSFLAHRFAGLKTLGEWVKLGRKFGPRFLSGIYKWRRNSQMLPPGISEDGGMRVRVSCRTRGLRLHVSPAYFINWVYFGSPTTPVESYLLPGRYVFAGDGPLLPRRRKDPTVFNIPADFYPRIVKF